MSEWESASVLRGKCILVTRHDSWIKPDADGTFREPRSHAGVYLVTQSLASSPASELMEQGSIAVGDRIHAVDGKTLPGKIQTAGMWHQIF